MAKYHVIARHTAEEIVRYVVAEITSLDDRTGVADLIAQKMPPLVQPIAEIIIATTRPKGAQ